MANVNVEISAKIDQFQKNLDEAKGSLNSFSNDAKANLKSLGASIQSMAVPAAAVSLAFTAIGLSAVKTFAELEGVKAAFDRLNNPSLLDDLRKATKGTTSDFELMKNAVQASNFKLPVEQLASLMEFASRRANDTGESVDYLVNSIVTGIGRKSPLILDNLGISATELKKQLNGVSMEAASIADVTEAVGRIASAELLKMGKDSDTLAEKFLRIKTVFTNEMVGMGETISKALSPAIGAIENLALRFQELSPEMKNMIVYVGAGTAAFAGLIAAAGAIITIAPLVAAAWTAIGGPIALVATGIAVAAALIIANWTRVKKFFIDTANAIVTVFYELSKAITNGLRSIGLGKLGATDAELTKLATTMRDLTNKSHGLGMEIDFANQKTAQLGTVAGVAIPKVDELSVGINNAADSAKKARVDISGLKDAIIALNGVELKKSNYKAPVTIGSIDRGSTLDIPSINITGIVTESQIAAIEAADAFNEAFNSTIGSGISGAISDFASGIGTALASGGNLIDAMGQSLLGALGGILTKMGEMAIQVGVGLLGIKAALKTLNPFAAIAAGVALIAVGSVFSAGARGLSGNIGGQGSGDNFQNTTTGTVVEPRSQEYSSQLFARGGDLYRVTKQYEKSLGYGG